MANLLTEQARSALTHRVATRITLLTSCVLLVAGGLVVLGALPAYLEARAVIAASDALRGAQGTLQEDRDKAAREEVVATKKRSTALLKIASLGAVTHVLPIVESARPKGVTVENMIYTAKGATSTLSISGATPGRQALQEYVRALEREPRFTEVEIPISALTKTENGEYTLLITGRF